MIHEVRKMKSIREDQQYEDAVMFNEIAPYHRPSRTKEGKKASAEFYRTMCTIYIANQILRRKIHPLADGQWFSHIPPSEWQEAAYVLWLHSDCKLSEAAEFQ